MALLEMKDREECYKLASNGFRGSNLQQIVVSLGNLYTASERDSEAEYQKKVQRFLGHVPEGEVKQELSKILL